MRRGVSIPKQIAVLLYELFFSKASTMMRATVLLACAACAAAFQGAALSSSAFSGAKLVETVGQLTSAPSTARSLTMDGKGNMLRGRIKSIKNTKKVGDPASLQRSDSPCLLLVRFFSQRSFTRL